MATHGPINGVKINRACSGFPAHILARTRFTFRPFARIRVLSAQPFFGLFLAPNPRSTAFRPRPPPSFPPLRPVLEFVIVDVIITQPSTIPGRWSRSLPLTARLVTRVTSLTRIVRSSAMARLASSFKPNLSPNMTLEMTLRSRRSYRTSDSR